jgi:hypothetical protein
MLDSHLEQREVSEWIAEKERELAALTPEEREARIAANLAERERYDNMTMPEMLKEIDDAMAEACGMPGWTYKDLPRMVPELFYKFIEIVGHENLHWIAMSNYGDTLRGQVLISPDGMEKLREFNA